MNNSDSISKNHLVINPCLIYILYNHSPKKEKQQKENCFSENKIKYSITLQIIFTQLKLHIDLVCVYSSTDSS